MKIDFKKGILRIFAVIGVIATLSILTGAFAAWQFVSSPAEPKKAPDSVVLVLDFLAPVLEKPADFSFSLPALLEGSSSAQLLQITRALKYAKDDPKVKGIVAKLGYAPQSTVHVQEITKALDDFRKSGKFSYAYAPSYGDFVQSGNLFLLASYFENRWLQPVGTVGLYDPATELPYGKSALKRFGIEPNFIRRAEYKSVMENFTHDAASKEVKENMVSLLSNVRAQKVSLLAKGLKIKETDAAKLFEGGPYTSGEAKKNNLITKLGYKDELFKAVEKEAGKDAKPLSPSQYLYFRNRDVKEEDVKGHIAIIYASGVISDQPQKDPFQFSEDGVIETKDIVKAFDFAAKDEDIKAILFRVNSPGGAPVASEEIRHAIEKAKESKKPVYVSLGAAAASGGYWIALEGDKIIADPATVTGSIGVVAGKFVLGGLFEKLGVKWDKLDMPYKTKDIWSVQKTFDGQSLNRITAMVDEIYNTFKSHVMRARNIPADKIDSIAKGRVFTGTQAVEAGLVDEIGTLDDALLMLKKEMKLKEDDIVMLHQLPPPETPETMLLKMVENLSSGGAMVSELLYYWQNVMTVIRPVLSDAKANRSINATVPYFATGL